MKKILLSVLLFLSSNQAWSFQYSTEGKIVAMFGGANNTVGIFHSAAWFNPAGCENGGTDKSYLIAYDSTKDWSKVTSMLLTAYTSGNQIRIAPSTSKCFAGYPVIERVAFVRGY